MNNVQYMIKALNFRNACDIGSSDWLKYDNIYMMGCQYEKQDALQDYFQSMQAEYADFCNAAEHEGAEVDFIELEAKRQLWRVVQQLAENAQSKKHELLIKLQNELGE